MQIFLHSLQEKSFSQPILIFAYSGWCSLCFRLEPIWKSAVEDLEPLGLYFSIFSLFTFYFYMSTLWLYDFEVMLLAQWTQWQMQTYWRECGWHGFHQFLYLLKDVLYITEILWLVCALLLHIWVTNVFRQFTC